LLDIHEQQLIFAVTRLQRPTGVSGEVEMRDLGDEFNSQMAVLDSQEDEIVCILL